MSAPINRVGSKLSTDSKTLAFLGKKAVLKRRFGFWSLLAFAVCELITWETVLALFSQGLENGGPAGLFWGFLIAWFSTMSVYVTISELASMAPIASGQYYWVYMLAPPSYRVIGSYLVGWLTTLAWIATVATESLFAGTIIQGLLILNYPSYESKQWQGTLLTWFVICINVFTNVILPDALPYIEMVVMVFHIGGFFGIMISLLVKTSQNEQFSTASAVFLTAFNNGGWSTQGLSFCIGFLGNVATFVGADASVHMAEEVEHASLNIPRAICYGMIINGAVGLAMMLTILFCLGDVESVLEGKTGFPFIQIFYNSVQSVPGAIAMGTIVLALTWCCSTGITTAASRMAWSFGRDKGLPFSNYIGKHDDKRGFPKTAVFVVTAFAALLTLIYIGSYAAFNDVISLTITGFYGSYLAPCALLLYHRFQDNIVEYGRIEGLDGNHEITEPVLAIGHDEKKNKATTPEPESTHEPEIWEPRLMWGPWRIGGWLGIINNMYACVYMVFVIFWSVWPATTPVVANTMNYSIVVTGGVLIFSAIYYYARGRESYKGPVKDVEVESTGHGIVNSESDHV